MAVGYRGDLILLEADPFDSISNTRRRAGVMAHGVYRSQQELNGLVDRHVSTYQEGVPV